MNEYYEEKLKKMKNIKSNFQEYFPEYMGENRGVNINIWVDYFLSFFSFNKMKEIDVLSFFEYYKYNQNEAIELFKDNRKKLSVLKIIDPTDENFFDLLSSENFTYNEKSAKHLFYLEKLDEHIGEGKLQFWQALSELILIIKFSKEIQNKILYDIPLQQSAPKLFDWLKCKEDKGYYFRGQADISWNLIPSMFRDFPCNKKSNLLTDLYEMRDIYEGNGLFDKYYRTIGKDECFYNEPYPFLSFMQHTICNSPLIDFTKDPFIALAFALNKKDSIFLNKDSALYMFKADGISEKEGLQYEMRNNNGNLNFFHLNEGIIPGRTIKVKYFVKCWCSLTLNFKTLKDIFKLLTPKFTFLTNKSNDRMKFQQGVFLLFYNYVSVKGKICYPLANNLQFTRLTIHKNLKEDILKLIKRNFPYVKKNYLMNPYSYFKKTGFSVFNVIDRGLYE